MRDPVVVATRAAVPGIALATYAWTASAALAWLDAPELTAASINLGIAHPPGEPPPVLLGRLVAFVPVGDLAFRVALASALAVTAAVAMCARATEAALGRAAPRLDARTRALLGGAAGLAFGWSWAAWFQAVRAEVYGLEAALLLGALALLLEGAEGRRLRLAALLAALAVATHSLVAAAFLTPCAVFAMARRPGVRRVVGAAGLAVLGLLVVLYLPLRAARDPSPNWGDPDSPSKLAWVLTARAFQKSVDHAPSAIASDGLGPELAQATGALVVEVSPTAAVLALVALYLLLRRRGARDVALLALALVACVALPPALVGFDADNPDAYGYLMPAVAVLALLASVALGVLADLLARRAVTIAAVGLALAWAGGQAVAHARDASLRHGERSEAWARALLDVPPRAVVVTSYFESNFLVLGLRALEGARPDVRHEDLGMRSQPGPHAPLPEGDLVLREDTALPPATRLAAQVADAIAPGRDALGLRRALLYTAFTHAQAACASRALPAQELLGILAALAPDDPDAAALRASCGAR